MSRERRRSSGSWRDGNRNRKERPQGTRSLRWLFTFLAVAMVIVFLVALYNPFRKDQQLFTIPIWTNDQLTAPPGVYLREDIDALNLVPDMMVHPPALAMQTVEEFEGLGVELKDGVSTRTDLVTLYIAAHGISQGEKPYLICSKFNRSSSATDTGLYPLPNVLRHLAACRGSQKLLILDCGRIAYAPSLGVVVNEFPQLVLEELQNEALLQTLGKQELWVMLPCTTFERSAVAHTLGRSVFGRSVSDALAGEADQSSKDRFITLFELYQYTFQQSRDWFAPGSGASLTPLLMKAGVGLVSPTESDQGDRKHRLVWLDGKQNKPVEEDEQETPSANEEDEAEGEATKSAARRAKAASGRNVTESGLSRWLARPPSSLAMLQPPAEDSGDAPQPDRTAPADEPPAAVVPPPAGGPSDEIPAAKSGDPPSATPAAVASEEEVNLEDLSPAERLLLDIRKQLATAWQLRDRIVAAEGSDGASPVHFAPHAWREANATLLSYEQRLYTGRTVQSEEPGDTADLASLDKLQRNVRELVADLMLLETAIGQQGELSEGQCQSHAARRLAKSFARYQQQVLIPNRARRLTATPDEVNVYRAVWQFDKLAYAARDYVRWHAAASITSSNGVPLHGAIEKWLIDLHSVQAAIDLLRQLPVKPNERARANQIVQVIGDLVKQQHAIDAELVSLAESAISNIQQPFYQQQIEDLLCTPLLPADLRMQLVGELTKPLEPILSASARKFPTRLQATREQWQRLVERLQLEHRLWLLADPGAAAVLQSQIGSVSKLVDQGLTDDASLWTACRNVGETLRKNTAGLAGSDQHRALRIADPRDAAEVSDEHPFYEVAIEFQQLIELQISGRDAEQLDRIEPRRITLTLEATKEELLRATIDVTVTEGLVKASEIPQRGAKDVRDGRFTQDIEFDITALMNQEEARIAETDAEFRVRWFDPNAGDYREAAHTVRLTLPRPNRLDLEVRRVGGSNYHPDDSESIDLALYPNRRTRYQFSLVNGSGVAKKVDVTLHAVPAEAIGGWRPGRISAKTRDAVYDAEGTKLVNAPVVAQTAKPVELSADGKERTLIDFVPPGVAAEPPAAASEAGTPPAAPPPPATAPAPDVSRGLLCVITNIEDKDDQRIKWIELSPLSPRKFLEPEIGYDYGSRRLVARLKAKDMDGDDKPDLPTDAAVRIAWDDPAKQIPAEAQKRLSGDLDSATDVLGLYAEIPPDNLLRTISLTVDGYPRAFLFEVPCAEQIPPNGFGPGRDIGATRIDARINSLAVPGDGREFHYAPFVDLPPVDKRDEKVEYLSAKRGQAVAISAPCDTIHLRLQVDAPVDAFRDSDDQIVVTLGEDLITPLRFYADRHMTVRLTKTGEQGLVELETEIRDYAVDLAPGNLENILTYVEVGVRLPRLGERRDRANVILDSDDPSITGLDVLLDDGSEPSVANGRLQVAAGQPLVARVYVKDTTGVGHAMYGFLEPGKQKLNPEKAVRFEPPDSSKLSGGSVVDLPVATKDLPPGLYTLQIEVTDRAKHEGEPAREVIEIKDPTAMPRLGMIEGRIRFGPNRLVVTGSLFKLSIESSSGNLQPVALQRDGSFSKKDLPAGEYKLHAEGHQNNRIAKGDLEGIVPWAPGSRGPLLLIVDHSN